MKLCDPRLRLWRLQEIALFIHAVIIFIYSYTYLSPYPLFLSKCIPHFAGQRWFQHEPELFTELLGETSRQPFVLQPYFHAFFVVVRVCLFGSHGNQILFKSFTKLHHRLLPFLKHVNTLVKIQLLCRNFAISMKILLFIDHTVVHQIFLKRGKKEWWYYKIRKILAEKFRKIRINLKIFNAWWLNLFNWDWTDKSINGCHGCQYFWRTTNLDTGERHLIIVCEEITLDIFVTSITIIHLIFILVVLIFQLFFLFFQFLLQQGFDVVDSLCLLILPLWTQCKKAHNYWNSKNMFIILDKPIFH